MAFVPGEEMVVGILDGKVALIREAARGQGAAEALLLAAARARVVLGDVLDGVAVASSIGDDATYVHLDVTSDRGWESCR